MPNYARKGEGNEREDMKFHMYCIMWKQHNDIDKIKKGFPTASSCLPQDLGKLDTSMPNVSFCQERLITKSVEYVYGSSLTMFSVVVTG